MQQGTYCIVLHYDAHDLALMDLFGDIISEDWCVKDGFDKKDRINRRAFAKEIFNVIGFDSNQDDFIDIHSSYLDFSDQSIDEEASVEARKQQKVYGYTQKLLEFAVSQLSECSPQRIVLAVNLLAFKSLTDTQIDDIIRAISVVLTKMTTDECYTNLVFLLRDSSMLVLRDNNEGTLILRKYMDELLCQPKHHLYVIDYLKRCCYNIVNLNKEQRTWRLPFSTSAFHKSLNASDEYLKHLLVSRSNFHIGHFSFNGVHIRTHYDINEYLKHDIVCEELRYRLLSLFRSISKEEDKHRCIVVTGIHDLRLMHIAYTYIASGIVSYAVAERDRNSYLYQELVRRSDCFVILTDSVYSGRTIDKSIESIKRIKGSKQNVKLFTIFCMSNSVQDIGGCRVEYLVKINRLYFEEKQCPLCKCFQKEYNIGSFPSDPMLFRHSKMQMSPMDFWELVYERQSLLLKTETQRAKFDVWVSLSKSKSKNFGIVDFYNAYLKSFLEESLSNSDINPGDVDAIVTVDDSSGFTFSCIVARVLDLTPLSVIKVSRNNLKSLDHGDFLQQSGRRLRVLIADASIVTGETISSLIQVCSNHEIKGVIVFDSRLSLREQYRYDINGNIKIISLYNWNSGRKKDRKQLESMIRHWDSIKIDYDPIGILADYCLRTHCGIERIFDMNQRIYNQVFCNDSVMTDDERIALIGYLSDESDLDYFCSDVIKNKYRKLYNISSLVKDRLGNNHSDNSISNVHIDAEYQLTDYEHAEQESGYPEPGLCTVPLYANDDSNTLLGNGFLIYYPNENTHEFGEVFIITCKHVGKSVKNNLTFIYNGTVYHAFSINNDKLACLAYDIRVLGIEGLCGMQGGPHGTSIVIDECCIADQVSTFEEKEVYHQKGYNGGTRRTRETHKVRCESKEESQSGEMHFSLCMNMSKADFDSTNKKGDIGILPGSSGSPVYDNENHLCGMVTQADQDVFWNQSVTIIPAYKIIDIMKLIFGECQYV